MYRYFLIFVIFISNLYCDITYNRTSGPPPIRGKFIGDIDLTLFDTSIPIVVTVIAITIATTLAIRALSSAKQA